MDKSGRTKKKMVWSADTYLLLGFVFIAIVVFLIIPTQIQEPKISFGQSAGQISASLFPRLAAIGLLLTAILALIEGRLDDSAIPFAGYEIKTALQLAVVTALLLAFALLFEPLGFLVSSMLISVALSIFLGNRSVIAIGLVCFAVPASIYVIFTRFLLISLPEGILY